MRLLDLFSKSKIDHYEPTSSVSMDGASSITIFFIPIILLWNIEAHRHGNAGSLGSWYAQNLHSSIKPANL